MPVSPPPFRMTGGGVELGGDEILRGVNLTVSAGEFLALLGQNGTGKTTLLRSLLGLQPLSAGTLEVLGVPVRQFRDWPRLGYVPQHLVASGAVPVSVREVVSAGMIDPGRRLRRPRHGSDRIRTALERVDLWHRRSDSFHTLSGGQQRRVMIAAVMVKGADILLLDEPTAGVDRESVALLRGLLADLSGAGATVVLVSHELGVLEDLVSRVVVLGRRPGGSVLYDGPPPPPDTLRDPHGHHDPEPDRRDSSPGWSA